MLVLKGLGEASPGLGFRVHGNSRGCGSGVFCPTFEQFPFFLLMGVGPVHFLILA